MKNFFLLLCVALCASSMSFAQNKQQRVDTSETFLFTPGDDGFYRLQGNNSVELERLYAYVDRHLANIKNGLTTVHVHGYNSGLATQAENLRMAKTHSNRVKSELIVNKGLKEENFRTENKTVPYEGHKSAVVIYIDTPRAAQVAEVAEVAEAVREYPHKGAVDSLEKAQKAEAAKMTALQNRMNTLENRVAVVEGEEVLTEAMVMEMIAAYTVREMEPAWKEPYCFALRTNLLYWAGLLPNLGVEWRIGRWFGIKIDGGYSDWKFEQERSHKLWMVNPEIRFYLGQERRIYLGLGGNFGQADMSWRPFSRLYNADHGYKGDFWNAGLVLGYQARLSRELSLDFNLGFGMSRFNYDTYQVSNTGRVDLAKDLTRDVWGVTQAGVTLVWRIN